MAQRRMFSPDIVESDAFLEMPASAHSLYFHLGMYADDDGFVSPRKIMRLLGSTEDDIKLLIAKKFVLPFDNGVIVIKHWKINNLVRKDWYRPTQYIEQKEKLFVKENGAYTLDSEQGIPLVNDSLTVRPRSIGKDSIEIPVALRAPILVVQEESARVPKAKDRTLENAAKHWHKKCMDEYGIEPSSGLSKTMAVLKEANKHLTWQQIKQKMVLWFDEGNMEPYDMIQITKCFSKYQIDKFKNEYVGN